MSPSKEKILNSSLPMEIIEFKFSINPEKQIDLLNITSPKFRIAEEVNETILIICSQKKKQKFINMPYIINLKKNERGL